MKSHKLVLYLSCFLMVTFVMKTSTYAQKFEGGILAGLCASQVAGDTYSGYDKAGLFAGGYVSLPLNNRVGIRLELDYIQKGSRNNPKPDLNDYSSYLMRLGYVEMPLLVQYHVNNKLVAEVGPAMSFLLHASEKVNQEPISYNQFKKQNLSVIAGISYLVTERVSAGLRTNNSLISIRKDRVTGDVWRFFDYGQFNDVLVLTIGYKL